MKVYGSREEKQYLTGIANLAASIWLLTVAIAVGIIYYFPVTEDPIFRPMADLLMAMQLTSLASCAAALLLRCMSKGVSIIWGIFPLIFMGCIFAMPAPFNLFAVISMLITLLVVLLLPDQWENSLRWTGVQHRMPHIPGPYRS